LTIKDRYARQSDGAINRLEEKREKQLRQSLPELQAALPAYAEANAEGG